MFVEFKEITFSNILSFGANPTTINFKDGLNLITGINGSGKSAILDALSFCLYGKPYRKIRIEELINRRNKGKLKVSCNFTVDDNKEYTIVRGLKPNIIEIYQNGEELDLLSSKKLNQEEIDNIIGINYQLFKQVISLAINYNKPFLSLASMEKRDIIEQIFNIKIFGLMLRNVKKDNTELRTKHEINRNSLKIMEESIRSNKKRISELNKLSKNFESTKKKDIVSVNKRIASDEKDKVKSEKLILKNKKRVDTLSEKFEDINSIRNKREIIISKINEHSYVIKTNKKNIKSLEKNTVCPLCNMEITPEHKEKEIKRINNLISKSENILEELNKEKINIDELIEVVEETNKEIRELNNENNTQENKIKIVEGHLEQLLQDKIEIENRKLDFDLDSMKKEFEEKKEEYKTLFKTNKSLREKIINNDVIISVLSDSGIKAFLFKKLIPILNSKINEYLNLFDLHVRLEFDEYMEEKISNIENMNESNSYYTYSSGEQKRIDISILLAFISMTKIISNWQTNLIIFDELLEGAMDEKGLEKIITSLRAMIEDNDKLCLYVISHRLQELGATDEDGNNIFKNKYKISKDTHKFSIVKSDK